MKSCKKALLFLLALMMVAGCMFGQAVVAQAETTGSSASITASSAKLYRGDTFTVDAYLDNTQPTRICTVRFEYDEAVLELVSGECKIPNTSVDEVLPELKVGTALVNPAVVVNGNVFTFTFKVKEDAAFGASNINVFASIGMEAGECIPTSGTSVEVVCNHEWGNWSAAVNSWQKRICSICFGEETCRAGWVSEGGKWCYYKDGVKKTGWLQEGSFKYYFDANGEMQINWQLIDGTWYYFRPAGNIAVGWAKIGDFWYYFDDEGMMQTGWKLVDGIWYYLTKNGNMASGWQKIDGLYYYFNSDGMMQTGWKLVDGIWYYFRSSGEMATGWSKIGGVYYYFNRDGMMQTGWKLVDGTWYYFRSSGEMATGWNKIDGVYYYFTKDGYMKTGWMQEGGIWYYFRSSGAMATGSVVVGGVTYNFSSSGACLNP